MILFREAFFKGLSELARKKPVNLEFGPTSWNYEGWRGIVYWNRYRDLKHFKTFSLEEVYKFPLFSFVEVDFTYYSFPTTELLARFKSAPLDFPLVFKVPKTFMDPCGGDFLNFAAFQKFLNPFNELEGRNLVFHFQFSYLNKDASFIKGRLLDFIGKKASSLVFSVEFRNSGFLRMWEELLSLDVVPTLNHWSYMPSLSEQATFLPKNLNKVYIRLLTPRNVSYSEAVRMFKPYSEIKKRNMEARKDLKQVISKLAAREFYIAVNNRFEGCSPLTIKELVEDLINA